MWIAVFEADSRQKLGRDVLRRETYLTGPKNAHMRFPYEATIWFFIGVRCASALAGMIMGGCSGQAIYSALPVLVIYHIVFWAMAAVKVRAFRAAKVELPGSGGVPDRNGAPGVDQDEPAKPREGA